MFFILTNTFGTNDSCLKWLCMIGQSVSYRFWCWRLCTSRSGWPTPSAASSSDCPRPLPETQTRLSDACAVRTCRTDTHSSLSSHRISFSLKVSDVLKSIKNCKIHLKIIWNQPLQKDSCCIKQSVKYPNISKWSQKIVRLLCNLSSLHTVTYSICTGYDPTWSWRVD